MARLQTLTGIPTLAITFRYSGRRIGHPPHLCEWGRAGAWMRTSDNPASHCIIGLLMRNKGADERTRTAVPAHYECAAAI